VVFGFGTLLITSRFLMPAGRGSYVLGLLTVTVVVTLFGSLGLAVTHHIGSGTASARSLLSAGLGLSVVLGATTLAVLLFLSLSFFGRSVHSIGLFALGLPAVLVTQTVSGTLTGIGRIRHFNVLQILPQVLTLMGMIGLVVVLRRGVSGAAAAWVIGQWLVAITSLALARDLWWPLRGVNWLGHHAVAILRLGMKLGLVNAVGLLNYRVELFILEAYRGVHDVGIYSLAESLAETLWIASSSIAIVLVAGAVTSSSADAAALVARGVRSVLTVLIVVGVFLIAGAIPLLPLVFGRGFTASIAPLAILIPGAVAFAPAGLFAVYFSVRLGRTRYPLLAALISAAITAVVAVVFVPSLGPSGAAIATTAGYSVAIICESVWFLRATGLSPRALFPTFRDLESFRILLRRP